VKEKPFEERFFPSPPAPPPSFSKPFRIRFSFLALPKKKTQDEMRISPKRNLNFFQELTTHGFYAIFLKIFFLNKTKER